MLPSSGEAAAGAQLYTRNLRRAGCSAPAFASCCREEEDLKGGAVLKGIVEAGEGDATPQAGDLVFLHYSLLDEHREVVCSTHLEHGGNGSPQPFVLGRGQRMLRGMELSVLGAPLAEQTSLHACNALCECSLNLASLVPTRLPCCRDAAGGERAA